ADAGTRQESLAVLADARAPEELASLLEGGVRRTGDLPNWADELGHRATRPLRLGRLARQSLADDQPAAVGGTGDLIGVIGCQVEEIAVPLQGRTQLVVALGALHEDHAPA